MDEAAWQAATPVTDFRQLDPNEGQPVSERTEARILIDDDAVYVGMRLYDRDPRGIQSQLARRDEPIDGDLVEVTFDSYHDHLSAVIFRLSAGGARRDATVKSNGNRGQFLGRCVGWRDVDRLRRMDGGIPDSVVAASLQSKREPVRSGVAARPKNRAEGRGRVLRVHAEGAAAGHQPLRTSHRTWAAPIGAKSRGRAVRAGKEREPGARGERSIRTKNNIAPGVGLDVKVGLTSNLTLDATVNPDFGQVEVDPAVVNLSAFETFFPGAAAILRRGLEHLQLRLDALRQHVQRIHVLSHATHRPGAAAFNRRVRRCLC